MIGYVTVGTSDVVRAAAFYDALFDALGEHRLIDTGTMVSWGKDWDQAMFAIAVPADGGAAAPGHGGLVALLAPDRAKVDAAHRGAVAAGGADDGAPAVRGEAGSQEFYAGYLRDLDGNRLCIFHVGPNAG